MASVLILDDDFRTMAPFRAAISRNGYNVFYTSDETEAFSYLSSTDCNVRLVFADMKSTRTGAIGFIKKADNILGSTPVVIIGPGNTMLYKDGIFYEYLDDNILKGMADVLEVLLGDSVPDNVRASTYPSSKDKYGLLVGKSQGMKMVYAQIDMISRAPVSVLIQGETGTGKELVARTLHMASDRRGGPFVAVNCGAIPSGLIESELFGHERGAYTSALFQRKGKFETAHKGTIFLDEISELQMDLQVKLLRVLQEREFERVGGNKAIRTDVRVVAATSKDLLEEVRSNRFREDLFYRLNVFMIKIPPLRQRKEDIPLLARHFIEKYSKQYSLRPIILTDDGLGVLIQCPFQGNVRELENLVIKLCIYYEGQTIGADEIKRHIVRSDKSKIEGSTDTLLVPKKLREYESEIIIKALEKTNGNKKAAAELLGITRRLLYSKLKQYGIFYKERCV